MQMMPSASSCTKASKKLPITLGIHIAVGVSVTARIRSNANHDEATGEGKCQRKGSR
jgi:hypothetical protein